MLRYENDRSEFTSIVKPAGVKRVICLGDSLVYSQGVHNHETLSAQLETFLNQAHWEEHVEVINAGRSGSSIYDDFAYYQCRCLDLDADLVVLVLVDNDAEFIGTQEGYSEHLRRIWLDDSPEKKMIGQMLKKVGQYFKSTNTPFMVAFSDIYAAETAKIAQEVISAACRENEISYLDISAQFQGTNTVSSNESLRVSPADGHPSVLGLSIIAKTLARSILKGKFLKGFDKGNRHELDLYESIQNDTAEFIRRGCRPEASTIRAKHLLESKYNCRARSRVPESLRLEDHKVQELLTNLDNASKKSVDLEHLRACCSHISKQGQSRLQTVRSCIERYSFRLIRELFLAGEAFRNPEMEFSMTEDLLINLNQSEVAELELGDKFQADWRGMLIFLSGKIDSEIERISKTDNFLQTLIDQTDDGHELDKLISNLQREAALELLEYVGSTRELIRVVKYCANEFSNFMEAHADQFQTEDHWKIALRQFMDCYKLLLSMTSMSTDFRIHEIPVIPVNACEQPLLKISLSACSDSEQPQWVEVKVTPTSEHAGPYKMNHTIVLDGKWRTYEFSVPLTQFFDIEIDAWPLNNMKLGNTVKLSYWTGEKIEFLLDNAIQSPSDRPEGKRWSAQGLSLFLLRQAA